MTINLIWSIVLAAVGILGIYLAGSKNIWGWAVSFGAQALWFIFALVTKQYGFILSALAYGWVYGRNYIRWRRERDLPPPKPIFSQIKQSEDGAWQVEKPHIRKEKHD